MKSLYYFSLFVFALSIAGCRNGPGKKVTPQKQAHQQMLPPPPDLLPVRQYDQTNTEYNYTSTDMAINSQKSRNPQAGQPDVRDPRVRSATEDQRNDVAVEALRVQSPPEEKLPLINPNHQMSIICINKTEKPIAVCCFYYTKLRQNAYWRWIKSPSFFLDPHEICTIPIKAEDDVMTKENIYGYLGIFEDPQEIKDATYENLPDAKKIDLDRLLELKNASVEIVVDQYGFKREQLDYRIRDNNEKDVIQPELDFMVENQTGKPVFVTCFVYQKTTDQDSLVPWKYDKTSVHKLEPGQSTIVDIETIKELYDWIYMRGFLAVFDAHEKEKAYEATYELLEPDQKIALGRLADVLGKKIILTVEKYGPAKKMFEFQRTPVKRIDFEKAYKSKAVF